jgi:hypothetical protein
MDKTSQKNIKKGLQNRNQGGKIVLVAARERQDGTLKMR